MAANTGSTILIRIHWIECDTPHALLHFTGSGVVYAFIPDTLFWLHVGDLPEPMESAVVLPSDELVMVDEESDTTYKASLQGTLVLSCFMIFVS